MNNNVAESYNSVVCKFTGGKRINYSLRYSYALRCTAAALFLNMAIDGQNYYEVLHKKITGCSSGTYTKTLSDRNVQERKRKGHSDSNFLINIEKKRKLQLADENYGQPDLPDKIFVEKKNKNFLKI